MVVAYIRVSTDKQDLQTQKYQIKKYCKEKNIYINHFICIKISAKQTQEKRKILELKQHLKSGDCLISTEISRLGRSMLETLNLVLELSNIGVSFIFLRQPELTTFENSYSKLILAFYAYMAELERDFISQRTRAGLEKAKLNGKILGRPKNSLNSIYDKDLEQIKSLLNKKIAIKKIWRLLGYDKNKKYETLYYFCKSRNLI